MFDTIPNTAIFGTSEPEPVDELRRFAERHRDGLLNAAGMLGGSQGIRTAQSALNGLSEPGELSRRTVTALDDLLDLLMLEHVHEPSRIEAALFAEIDPASPVVEEICLLADQLSDLLDGCEADGTPEKHLSQRAAA